MSRLLLVLAALAGLLATGLVGPIRAAGGSGGGSTAPQLSRVPAASGVGTSPATRPTAAAGARVTPAPHASTAAVTGGTGVLGGAPPLTPVQLSAVSPTAPALRRQPLSAERLPGPPDAAFPGATADRPTGRAPPRPAGT